MFGEDESESPRVPSPWDSLISVPPSPVSSQGRAHTPSPLAVELIPRLVPEADDGNVEYKLQLLNPSPARFARLVTQMKWRLLEGGGQAYYELGVADSGDLIGLPREELEQSLETLEMMAGEIGASVIVVKEIEVPAAMATLAKRSGEWAGGGGKRLNKQDGGYSTGTTEMETDPESLSGTDIDTDDLSLTVVLDKGSPKETSSIPVASLESDSEDPADAADDERVAVPRFSIDLEISSVFKPRPIRTRVHNHPHYAQSTGGKARKVKKYKHLSMLASPNTHGTNGTNEEHKNLNRRQSRDKRREEKRKALEARVIAPETDSASTLIPALESLHVGVVEEPVQLPGTEASTTIDIASVEDFDDDDDVFPSPKTTVASFPTFSVSSTGESHLDVDTSAIGIVGALSGGENGEKEQPRLIVEALVVRKMSLGEAFLDFGGFSLT
ncbi:hypothetical protein CVT25_013642 [Psilocybe cyanescens]|uniref:Uncharacterized protein n=1 Tax=Psilocybe cyanescens TaxID=93625 RepID=A0A409WTE2_PSICY|nr:hypothetical protein CVT25_013642 [Psilocybe cyanescens]